MNRKLFELKIKEEKNEEYRKFYVLRSKRRMKNVESFMN